MKNPSVIHQIKAFLGKFKKIPEQQWATTWERKEKDGRITHCALGHLGILGEANMTPEGMELCTLLHPITKSCLSGAYKAEVPCAHSVTAINDCEIEGVANHPRERLTWALRQRLTMELGYEPSAAEEDQIDLAL